MSNPTRLSSRAWVAIPLCGLGFLILVNVLRVRRVEYVSAVGEPPATDVTGSSAPGASPGWQPRLIVPEHDNVSYEWLDQTRQMFARGEWRVRYVAYENAPIGREVFSPSPYRWWLGLIAELDHAVSGRPIGQSVERAALVADPLLHVLLLAGATLFTAWQFGAFPAALLALGLATIFPFAAGYLPGAPNDQGLVQVLAFWSVLPLLAGIKAAHSPAADAGRRTRRWFLVAGITGGLGLWIGAAGQVPILVGIALGGLVAAWVARGERPATPAAAAEALPWLTWALAGAATSLAAYLLEYFPTHLGSWQLRVNHPLYGLAWLGGGALLAQAVARIQGKGAGRIWRDLGLALAAATAVAALPVVMWRTRNPGFLATDLPAFRLTRLSGDLSATSLWAWIVDNGPTPQVWMTVLPVLLVVPAVWLIGRRRAPSAARLSLAVALGPVILATGFACWQLRWWNQVDLMVLILLVAVTAASGTADPRRLIRWVWSGAAALILLPGAIQVFPRTGAGRKNALNEAEILGLIERDLARWLAVHAGPGGALVLAPHNQTVTLYYYGGIPGLATLDWENLDGLGVAVRILSASTPEEAKELIDRRGVTHLVIPSWDSYLDVYARMGMGQLEGTFLKTVHEWVLPTWLRPVPYQLPTIAGFEGESVVILQVTDEQNNAATLSRIAEYFVEMNQLEMAASAGQALRRFPADLGALAARAQVEIARGDTADFDDVVALLQRRLASGADRVLPWDRRVSVAVVLALSKHVDPARDQVQRCLTEINEAKLRSLTTISLYRLQVLAKAYGLTITDPRLRALALELLPSDLRRHL